MNDSINKIRSYVLRSGKMSAAQRNAYEKSRDSVVIPFMNSPIISEQIFKNKNPLFVEIGFGMGDATISLAKKNPEINYIGIEVHKPGIGRVLMEIERQNLLNLKIIEHDAVEVFEEMISSDSLGGVHIFYPDPWHKQKHNKRRLIQKDFIHTLALRLRNNGYLYAVTDWENYAEHIMSVFSNEILLTNAYISFSPRQVWRPETKFEKKGYEKNHATKELFFIKKGGSDGSRI